MPVLETVGSSANTTCIFDARPISLASSRRRKPEDIIHEIEELVADGVVEVMLLGQNVNSYGKNLEEPISFAQLLERVEQIDGLKRIRFMTSHPKDLSDELIEVMAKSKKIYLFKEKRYAGSKYGICCN